MALQFSIDTPQGITATNAYHRVEVPEINFPKTKIIFRLRSYARSPGLTLPAFDDRGFECPFDIAGANVFAQAYAWLKATYDPTADLNAALADAQAALAAANERAAQEVPDGAAPALAKLITDDVAAAQGEVESVTATIGVLEAQLAVAATFHTALAGASDV